MIFGGTRPIPIIPSLSCFTPLHLPLSAGHSQQKLYKSDVQVLSAAYGGERERKMGTIR